MFTGMRALIAPDGKVLKIPAGSYHGTEALKIWHQIDPSRVNVDPDGFMSYKGGSALYDLIEQLGYIAIGSSGGQELKASKAVITNPRHPATVQARILASSGWTKPFFEAEIGELPIRIYLTAPFENSGKLVRRDLKRGPLEPFEELPEGFEEQKTMYKDVSPEDLFADPQAAGGEEKPKSMRELRKMLERYSGINSKHLEKLSKLFEKRGFYKAAQLIK